MGDEKLQRKLRFDGSKPSKITPKPLKKTTATLIYMYPKQAHVQIELLGDSIKILQLKEYFRMSFEPEVPVHHILLLDAKTARKVDTPKELPLGGEGVEYYFAVVPSERDLLSYEISGIMPIPEKMQEIKKNLIGTYQPMSSDFLLLDTNLFGSDGKLVDFPLSKDDRKKSYGICNVVLSELENNGFTQLLIETKNPNLHIFYPDEFSTERRVWLFYELYYDVYRGTHYKNSDVLWPSSWGDWYTSTKRPLLDGAEHDVGILANAYTLAQRYKKNITLITNDSDFKRFDLSKNEELSRMLHCIWGKEVIARVKIIVLESS